MSQDSKVSENLQGADLLRAIRQIEAGISIILPKLVELNGTIKDTTSYKREDLPINSVGLAEGASNYEIIDLTLEDSPILLSPCSETSENHSLGNRIELTKCSKSYQETTLTEPLKQISQLPGLCGFTLDQPQNVENVALDRELHCYTEKESSIIRNSQQDLASHPRNAYKTSKNTSNKSELLELLHYDDSYYLPKPVMRKSNYSRDANLEKRMAEKIERVKKKLEKPRSLKLLLLKEKNPLCRPVGRPRKITKKSEIQKVRKKIKTIGCANSLPCEQRIKSKNAIIFPVNAFNDKTSCSCNATSSSKTNNSNNSVVTHESSETQNPVDSEVGNSACATTICKDRHEPTVTNQLPNLSTPMTNPTEVSRISSSLNVEVLPKPDVRLIEMRSNEALSSCSSDHSKKSSLKFSTSSVASVTVAPSDSVEIQEICNQETSTNSLEVESSVIADTKSDLPHTAKLDSVSVSVSTVASFSFESHLAKLSKKQIMENSQTSKSAVDQLSESAQVFPSMEKQETLQIINSVLVKSVTEEISKTDFVKRLEPNSLSINTDDSKIQSIQSEIQSVETTSLNKDNNKNQPLRSNSAVPLISIEKQQTVNSVPSKSILEETLKTSFIEQSKSNCNVTTTALLEIMQKEDSVSNNIPHPTCKSTEDQSNDSLTTGNTEYNVIRKVNGYSQLIVPCEIGNTIISWKDPTIQDDVPSVMDSVYSQNSLQVKKPLIRVKNFSDMKENNVIMHDKASWHLPSPIHKVTDSLNTTSPDCTKDLILVNKNATVSYTDQTKAALDNMMSARSNQIQASEKMQSYTEPAPQTFHQSNTVSCSGEAAMEDNDSMVHSLLTSGLQKKFDEFLFNILVYEMEKSPAAIIQEQKKINLQMDELQKAIDCFFKTCKSSAYFITVVQNILQSTLRNFLKNYLSVEKYLKFVINVPSKVIREVFKASGSSWEEILKNVVKDCFRKKKIARQRTIDETSKTAPTNKKRPAVEIPGSHWSKSSVLEQMKHNTNITRDQSCIDTLPAKKFCGNPSVELPNINQHKLNEVSYCRLPSYSEIMDVPKYPQIPQIQDLKARYNYRNQAQPYGFISSQHTTPLLTHQEPHICSSNMKILQKDAPKYSPQTSSQAPQKLFKTLAEQLQAQQRRTISSAQEIHQQNQSGVIISQQMGLQYQQQIQSGAVISQHEVPQYQQQIKSGATIFQPKVPQYQQQTQLETTSLQQVIPQYQLQNLSRSIISPQGVPQSHHSSNQSVSSFPAPVTKNSTPISKITNSCLAKLLQTRSISSVHNASRMQSNSKLSCAQNYQKFQGCTQSKSNSNYLECGEFDNYSPTNCMSAYPQGQQSVSMHSQIQFSSNLLENGNVFDCCYQQTVPSEQMSYSSYEDMYHGNINTNVNINYQQNNHSNTGTRSVTDFPIQETFDNFGITNNLEQQPLSVNHINSSSASPDSNESPIFVNRTPPLHKPISVPVVQSSSKTPDISNNNTPENIEDHASKENYQKKTTENLVQKIKSTSDITGFEQCDDLLNEFIDHTWVDA